MGWRIEKRSSSGPLSGQIEYLRDASGDAWDFGEDKQAAAILCDQLNRERVTFSAYFVLLYALPTNALASN